MSLDLLDGHDDFRLGDLLLIHNREEHPLGLKDSLGDGALLHRNPHLLNLRKSFIQLGFRIESISKISGIHSMFPILELDEILRTKVIPYRRTALAAEHTVRNDANFRISDQLFRECCNASHVHHEGCHALFDSLIMQCGAPPRGVRLVEAMLVAEAFAMSFEQFVALCSVTAPCRSTTLFLAANSYANPLDLKILFAEDSESLSSIVALAEQMPYETMSILVVAHLIAMLRPSLFSTSPAFAERIAEHVGGKHLQGADTECLVRIGLQVSSDFRVNTLRQYFCFKGLSKELENLRAESLESLLSADRVLDTVLPIALEMVLGRREKDRSDA